MEKKKRKRKQQKKMFGKFVVRVKVTIIYSARLGQQVDKGTIFIGL